MDIRNIQSMLEGHGHACLDLAKKLNDRDGEPLNTTEKELMRLAAMPIVSEACDLIKSAFMVGNTMWLDNEQERLEDLIKSIM